MTNSPARTVGQLREALADCDETAAIVWQYETDGLYDATDAVDVDARRNSVVIELSGTLSIDWCGGDHD